MLIEAKAIGDIIDGGKLVYESCCVRSVKNRFAIPALIAVVGFILAGRVTTQRSRKTRSALYAFGSTFCTLVGYSVIAQTAADLHWDDQFPGPPGVEGNVLCLAVQGSDTYVGGQFSTVGGGNVVAANVAKWDGSHWWSLGAGVGGPVNSLVRNGSELYAGGSFTNAGGLPANRIAMWDGSGWSPLGMGVNGDVYAIAASGTNLYVGGAFTTAGGAMANRIAKWDGTGWSPLGTGMNNNVRAILVNGSDLYAGGNFTTAGGTNISHIARWDGTNWLSLSNGLSGGVQAMAIAGTDLYAGGSILVGQNNIARWDGTKWNALGSQFANGVSGAVSSIAVIGSAVYVGGSFLYAQGPSSLLVNYVTAWQNGSWSRLGSGAAAGVNAPVYALAASGTNLWVGGSYTFAGGVVANRFAEWNGNLWQPAGTNTNKGVHGSVFSFCLKDSDLYVGGSFANAGGVSANNIVKWDGTTWAALGDGLTGGNLSPEVDTIAVAGSDLIIGGYFWTAGSITASNIVRWDGTNWYPLGNGTSAPLGSQPYVKAVAVSETNVYAAGTFTYIDGMPADYIAKWDGTSWSALPSSLGDDVYALMFLGDNLFVGGSFPYLKKWTGTNWETEFGVNNSIHAFCLDGNNLYVGGAFTTSPPNRIGVWDGTNWLKLGQGITNGLNNGAAASIVKHENSIYVGGLFTVAGGFLPVQNIVRWDGTNWSTLGSGLNGGVKALIWNGDDLYVGGDFTRAGGKASYHIARWNPNLLFGLPLLSIAIVGEQAVVSWPVEATNYVLETSPDLASTNWTQVPTGGQTTVTNDILNAASFFRLRLP